MTVILEALPARHGDCLLLHYGPPEERQLVLIDGGPARVWRETLSRRLDALRAAQDLEDHQGLLIRLVMVSHIDDDHIRGILELTDLLCERRDDQKALPYRIEELWHNSFDDIVGNQADRLYTAAAAVAGAASGSGFSHFDLDPHAQAVIASVPQGRALRNNARKLDLAVNRVTASGPLVVPSGRKLAVDLDGGPTLQILGPNQQRLDDLHQEWDEILREKGLDQSDGQAAAAAFVDKSVFNLSSLVVLAAAGSKRALLTGDARGDDVLAYLREAGALADGRARFDVLKLPHHGSDRNVTPEFFEAVSADHYIVSGDGRHGNPELATIQMIREAQGQSAYNIHLTYAVDNFVEGYPKAQLAQLLADMVTENPEIRIFHPRPDRPAIAINL
jgi:hypothetical protein